MKKLFVILFLLIFLPVTYGDQKPDSLSSADSVKTVTNVPVCDFVNTGYDFFRTNEDEFYSAHLIYFSGKQPLNYFVIEMPSGEKYFSSPEDFIMLSKMGTCYPLMNFDFPFLTFKYNVSRFLHPNFVIKFLYLLRSLNGGQMISDAMRKSEEQLLYLRRGWTDVTSSPHMFGLAGDMVGYSGADSKLLHSLVDNLDVRFLEHGSRGNRHIHLQDNEIWKHVKSEFTNTECKVLNDSLCNRSLPVKMKSPNNEAPPFKNYRSYTFENDTDGIVKLEFLDKFGRTAGEIRAGVFKPGSHEIFYNDDFLKQGSYTLRIYFNYDFIATINFFII